MGDRAPLTTIVGSVDAWVGSDFQVLDSGQTLNITKLFVAVTDAPSGGSVQVQIRNEPGGAGDGISATIASGTKAATASGIVALNGTQAAYMRIASASGEAMNLSGWFETDTVIVVLSTMTTLARVKEHRGITSSTHDVILTNLISGVTTAMQRYMARDIVSTAYSGEKHDGDGRSDTIQLLHWPIVTPPAVAVTESETALAANEFEVEAAAGQLIRVSSGDPVLWAKGRRNISVNYTAGYASIPADLVAAATKQVGHEFHQAQPSALDALSQQNKILGTGETVGLISEGWLPGVIQAMNAYARWP